MTDSATFGPDVLLESPAHRALESHPFFAAIRTAPLGVDEVARFVGQWWHPLHYFPTFLARCVSVLPDIESKSAVTRILAQEVGGGDAARAHEVIYIESMARAGIPRDVVAASPPLPETVALVDGYERASTRPHSALGYIFATEVTDLLMVSSIGTAVARATGVHDNEWVRIHVEQEPEHVEMSELTLARGFTPEEASLVRDSAEELSRLWAGFFDRLHAETGAARV